MLSVGLEKQNIFFLLTLLTADLQVQPDNMTPLK